jgi:RNA polymerase sigma-70 factor (ECF subfamily)
VTDLEFRNAFHLHKDVLYRFAYRMTGSGTVAEDVVQDCFLHLWRKPDQFDPDRGTLRSWLLGIARNNILKRWRGQRLEEVLDDDAVVTAPLNIERRERSEIVAGAVAALPPLQREALILAEYEELSLDEIARATGMQIAAVKSRLHRARENLRRMLAPLLETKGNVYGTQR